MKSFLALIPAGMLLASLLPPFDAEAQVCNESLAENTPMAGFILHDDGTATHQATGLTWMRCSLGQTWDGKSCHGEPAVYSWGVALQEAARHEFAGRSDWRLPNKNELETIFEGKCHSPVINMSVFPSTPPSYYWSSSPYAGLGTGAWSLDFGYGSVNASAKSGSLHIRLVRGGE